jgi:hypothetical protein
MWPGPVDIPAPRTVADGAATATSANWAGYTVSGSAGSYRSAQATFVVPSLVSCASTETSWASFWAGLDGWGNGTVEQSGVDVTCQQGSVYYIPWYETYPAATQVIDSLTVDPGDVIVATDTSVGDDYSLSVADSTKGTRFSITVAAPGATSASAECITEDPTAISPSYGTYGYYGTARFNACTVDGRSIGTQDPTAIDTTTSGHAISASTSALVANTAFNVTRQSGTGPGPTTTSTIPTTATATTTSPAPPPLLAGPVVGMASMLNGDGYWLVNAAGAVSARGTAQLYGSMAGLPLNAPISHIVATSDGKGYWLVATDGGTFSFGDAQFFGSMGASHLNAPVVDMAPTADDRGYWLVASDGGIFSFGDAVFHGSMGAMDLNRPVVGIADDTATGGYWEVASDGGIFAFDAPFYGSTGALQLNQPITSMAPAAGGAGYWFVASDGGVFNFGSAAFRGSMGGSSLSAAVVGMASDVATNGYWLVGTDGSIFTFGAPFYGAD